jgi:hypothetical protein
MNKVLLTLAAIFAVVTAKSADLANIAVDAGYNNYYVVNGVSKATDTPYAGISAIKTLKFADVYVGAVLLPKNGIDESYWTLGLGETLRLSEKVAFHLTADATRNQTSPSGIPNSTEFGTMLSLTNPYITPYVRGSFDIDLHQNGVVVGLQRTQKLFWGFQLTPTVEYGRFTDYDFYSAKATLSRPIKWVTPYAEISWNNNDKFDGSKYTFATREFNNTLVYSAGVKVLF